jgi:hypothetical protein
MPLILKATACLEDKSTKLIITDTTGTYHATNNTGGWGTPNTEITDMTSLILTVVYPDGAEEEYDLSSQIPASVTGNIEYNFIPDDYPDGIYEFTLTYSGNGVTHTRTFKKLFVCRTQCCVAKMRAAIPEKFYDLSDKEYLDYLNQVLLAQGLMEGILAAGGCLKEDIVSSVLSRVQRLCNFEKCSCSN